MLGPPGASLETEREYFTVLDTIFSEISHHPQCNLGPTFSRDLGKPNYSSDAERNKKEETAIER
jgi:hypothetical protein